ncbi:hypothetical protein [Prolixibacter sp. NT017]|uniref:hypothetical protein n=1 Tax=Prolixibacter sp. NT017 TaxID=2652390 RepID=UPI0012990736|nr:hypothetical protein [Prolixibacter sp. NT017]
MLTINASPDSRRDVRRNNFYSPINVEYVPLTIDTTIPGVPRNATQDQIPPSKRLLLKLNT